jgi:hypothetical protein
VPLLRCQHQRPRALSVFSHDLYVSPVLKQACNHIDMPIVPVLISKVSIASIDD